MKESDRLLYRENHSSWRRLWMLIRFYWPRLRGPLLALVLLTAFLTLSIGVYVSATGHNAPWGAYFSISLLMLLSPMTLLLRDFRQVSSQLPVTAAEKLGALLFYFWLVFPWSVYLVSALTEIMISHFTGNDISQSFVSEYTPSGINYLLLCLCGIMVTMSIIVVELYYMLKARGNRAGVALVSVLAGFACYMFLVAVMCFIAGLAFGFVAARTGKEIDVAFVSGKVFLYVMPFVTGVLALVAVVYVLKLRKHLNNSGF